MTFKAASLSKRWLPFVIALAIAAALVVPGRSATAQPPPDLEALNNRLVGLFELNGVVFTDADEATGRLVVGIENKGLTRAVEQRLRVLGVSPQLVDIVESPPIHQLATLREKVRPLAGGLQIRFGGFLCTLGFNAVLGGVQGFVINSHCTDVQGGVEDTLYYQPLDQISGEFIGAEVADPLYLGNTCSGNIFPVRNRVCRWSDSAFAELDGSVAADLGYIEKTTGANTGSLDIDARFRIVGETTLGVGDTANKVGRTTGWTQAPVTRTCVHTGVSGSNIVQLCQTFVEDPDGVLVDAGDSGSPVFEIVSGDDVTLAGILWGGSTDGTLFVYSPLANIEMSDTELGQLDTVAGNDPHLGNNPPAAVDDSATTDEDTAVTIDVLANDTDADGDALTVSSVTQPADGSATNNADNTVTYTPSPDFNGSDSFNYTINDGNGSSDTATVTVTVNAVNDNPVAIGDEASTLVDTSVTIDVLANDTDVDGDTLTVSSVTQPADGSATNNADNTVTYTPSPDFNGSDSFTYTISDGNGGTDTATVTVTVNEASSGMHVGDLDGEGVKLAKGAWKAIVTVVVHDSSEGAVAGATVTGTFTQNGSTINGSCTTDANGTCYIDSGEFPSNSGKATFTVDSVTVLDDSLTYEQSSNHDPDGDSNGTTIQLSK